MCIPVFENSRGDTLINAVVLTPHGEELTKAKVKGRHVNNGQILGKYNFNYTLNSIIYDVLFPNGSLKQCAAITIAESLYSTLDSEGHSEAVLYCILEHAKDDRAIDKADKYINPNKSNRRLSKTTIGCNLVVQWKNQSESWKRNR